MLVKSLKVLFLALGIGLLTVSAQTEKPISKGVVNGAAVSLPKPVYPPAAMAVRAGGAVNVQVLIDEEGNVVSALAVSGHPLLRTSATEAAQAAKFKPTLLSGQAVKVRGVIVYNFIAPTGIKGDRDEEVIQDTTATATIGGSSDSKRLTVVNGSALNLVKPEYPAAARAVRASGAVNVKVSIDEEGNVSSAEAISGHPLLRTAAVNAALLSKFKPALVSGEAVKFVGVVVYNFVPQTNENSSSGGEPEESSVDNQKTIFSGVVNGKALSLPRPVYPAKAREERASGAVSVQVIIDEEGNVISANAVSGHELLRKAAEKAALGAKFSPTLLEGVPVKVSGVIVYNFVP